MFEKIKTFFKTGWEYLVAGILAVLGVLAFWKWGKKPAVPSNNALSSVTPRFKPAGGKPPLPFDKSYNRQGSK